MTVRITSKPQCCDIMQAQLNQKCDQHTDPFDCPDVLIYYSEQSHQYGIIIHDGGSSYSAIKYCPWCGAKLAELEADGTVLDAEKNRD